MLATANLLHATEVRTFQRAVGCPVCHFRCSLLSISKATLLYFTKLASLKIAAVQAHDYPLT
jgi:hypothetical protein